MKQVTLVEVLDPLNPASRSLSKLEWRDGMTVAEACPHVAGMRNMTVCLNGGIVDLDKRATTLVQANDFIVYAPVPEGGGGDGKSILRLIAFIVLVVVTDGYALEWGTALGIGETAMTVGMMVAGSMLINAAMPMGKPNKSGMDGGNENSPSYGIDGPKNTATEGIVTPVVYGTFRYGGNVIGHYTVTEELGAWFDNGRVRVQSQQRQWLHMLLNLGEGPVSAIKNIHVNGQPIETFVYRPEHFPPEYADLPAYQYYSYLGTNTQTVPTFFDKSINPKNVNSKLTTVYSQYTTSDKVDRLRFDLLGPQGLFTVQDDGSTTSAGGTVEIQYRKVGDTTWLPLVGWQLHNTEVVQLSAVVVAKTMPDSYDIDEDTSGYFSASSVAARRGTVVVDNNGNTVANLGTGNLKVTNGQFKIDIQQKNQWRTSITSDPLPEANYEVRYRRLQNESTDAKTFNSLYITDINEIRNEGVAYRNTALLAVKLLVTDKLNSVPTVTAEVDGRVIKVWNATTGAFEDQFSDNPAWIAYDMMTHTRYGGACDTTRFDIEKWKDWAAWCDTNNMTFDGVFDTVQSTWDAVQNVFRCGHASLVPSGTKFTVMVERPDTPVMMFSVGNMISGSFKNTWLPVTERANEVELTYQDRDDEYRQHTVKAVDQNALTLGMPQRTSSISMMGVTSAQRAWDEATFALNLNRYVLQTVSFSAPAESIACTVGDLVLVQHDMPKWGDAGRTAAGSTTTVLNLDREVTMDFGTAYQALVHFSQVPKVTSTIKSISGNNIVLNAFNATTHKPVRRMTVGGTDYRVEATITSGADYGVIVSDATGLSVGQTFTLYNTDEIATVGVNNPATVGSSAVVTSLTCSTALPAAPATFTNWMFGTSTKTAKPFRVKSIGGSSETERDITAIEYNESIYAPAGAAPTPNYSALKAKVDHAIITNVQEISETVKGVTTTKVIVAFGPSNSRQSYRRSEVLAKIGIESWRSLGYFTSEASIAATPGQLIMFRVIAEDLEGNQAEGPTAPETVYRVLGGIVAPSVVSGLASSFTDSGVTISWNPPFSNQWQATIVRMGTAWATAQQIYGMKGSFTNYGFLPVGTTRFLLRHEMTDGSNAGVDTTFDVTCVGPLTPTLSTSDVQSGSFALRWGNLKGSQPLKAIEIRVGATFGTASVYSVVAGDAQATTITFQGDATRTLWVRAQDMYGNWGTAASTSVSVTGTGNGDMTPPPTPTGISVTSRFSTNFVSWNAPSYSAGGGHQESIVYAATNTGTAPTIANATPIATIPAPGVGFADTCAPGSVRHYWVVHVSKTKTPSATGGGVNGSSVTTAKLASIDMDNYILDATKFASSIEPITQVTTVPTVKSTNNIFNTTNGKLYSWNSAAGAYQASAASAFSDLSGTISDTQIAVGAIKANKMAIRKHLIY